MVQNPSALRYHTQSLAICLLKDELDLLLSKKYFCSNQYTFTEWCVYQVRSQLLQPFHNIPHQLPELAFAPSWTSELLGHVSSILILV